jgi:hypothetical protein
MPLLEVSKCKFECESETYKRSIQFRTATAWNSLPKDWMIEIGKNVCEFNERVFNYIFNKRTSS